MSPELLEPVSDEIVRMTRAGEDVEDMAGTVLTSHAYLADICPECGRLLVFKEGLGKPAMSYKLEGA